jgi:glycosyltransferase involved in cell wall biosynthesis
MLKLADVVSTPSELLAEQYRALGAPDVRVLENYLPPEFESVRPGRHDGVVIAYLAGLEHQVDYQQLRLRDTFLRLLDAHPDLRVMSIGIGLGLPPDRYDHRPLVPFLELARELSRADIGIAPLVDIPWNRARSNVKLKEYASAQLPWLASPVGPYRDMGEEQGGLLVADDEWHAALEHLITHPRERRKLGKRGARWASREGIRQHAYKWESALQDAATRARERAGRTRLVS